jgi:pyridoxine kinase
LQKIFRILHKEYKVPHVVISSIPISDALAGTLPEWLRTETSASGVVLEKPDAGEPLLCITSSALADESEVPSVVHSLYIPRIPGYFSGVGDLFSALVLAHFHNSSRVNDPSQTPLSYAVAKSCQTTHALLWRTHRHSMSLPAEDRTTSDPELDARDIDRKVRRMKGRELRLVKDQDLILGKGLDADGCGLQEMREWSQFWPDT